MKPVPAIKSVGIVFILLAVTLMPVSAVSIPATDAPVESFSSTGPSLSPAQFSPQTASVTSSGSSAVMTGGPPAGTAERYSQASSEFYAQKLSTATPAPQAFSRTPPASSTAADLCINGCTVTFYTNPGTILIDGCYSTDNCKAPPGYSNGQSQTIHYHGTYIIYAVPPGCPNNCDSSYTAQSWSYSGSVTLSSTSGNHVTMDVEGAGTVTVTWSHTPVTLTMSVDETIPWTSPYVNMIGTDVGSGGGWITLSYGNQAQTYSWGVGSPHTLNAQSSSNSGVCATGQTYNGQIPGGLLSTGWDVNTCQYRFVKWTDNHGWSSSSPNAPVNLPSAGTTYTAYYAVYFALRFKIAQFDLAPGYSSPAVNYIGTLVPSTLGSYSGPVQSWGQTLGYYTPVPNYGSCGVDCYWEKPLDSTGNGYQVSFQANAGANANFYESVAVNEGCYPGMSNCYITSSVFYNPMWWGVYWGPVWVDVVFQQACKTTYTLTIQTAPPEGGTTTPPVGQYPYPAGGSPNLMCSPGFESGIGQWWPYWYQGVNYGNWGGTGGARVETNTVHSGNNAMEIWSTGITTGIMYEYAYDLSTSNPYTLSFWINIPDLGAPQAGAPTSEFRIFLEIISGTDAVSTPTWNHVASWCWQNQPASNYNCAYHLVNGALGGWAPPTPAPTPGWTQVTYTFSPSQVSSQPNMRAALEFELGAAGNGQYYQPSKVSGHVYLDDFSLTSGTLPTATPAVSETASTGYNFTGWTLDGNAAGTDNPIHVTMNRNRQLVATYDQTPTITVNSQPSATQHVAGFVTVNSENITTPRPYVWTVGTNHPLNANPTVSCGVGCQWVFTGWTSTVYGNQYNTPDQHAISYLTPSAPDTITANYKKQYTLTMQANPPAGGNTNPTSVLVPGGCGKGCTWQDAGSVVQISATPNTAEGYIFTGWTGTSTIIGSYTGPLAQSTVTMNAPIVEKATFTIQACPIG